MSPDGKRAVAIRRGNVTLIDLEGLTFAELTANAFEERYPVFSLDGRWVLLERRALDPTFRKRQVSVLGSVAVP